MLKEFKEFAMRGNILDMAMGIVIGAAFGKIVTSFVNDVLMPPIGLLLGEVDFTNLFINLSDTPYPSLAAAQEAGAPVIAWGMFVNNILDFIIIAFVLFLIIRQVNKMRREEEVEAEVKTKSCSYCKSEIAIDASRCPHCTSELK
ncbi:MAG: large conductance mechanosensitive channel protein MscL [Syntrophomonadaceae bacterium]|nr:large conductance mechanosensitive channel protein MscL [Syntrophomonadaceae bacterium]